VILGGWAALRRDWRWAIAHIAFALGYLFLFCPFRISWGHATAPSFTLITHNIGQGNKQAFSEAFPSESADAILLQDANYREKDYSRRYPQLRTRGVAQFLLLTPREIVSAAPVGEALWRGNPIAARFVIRVNDREIALYNVHLPTPRNSLRHVISARVGLEMLWLADAPTDDQPSYRAWLRARVTLAKQLHDVFSRESLPFLVAGDLNTPEHGVVYHQIASGLQDAHATVGRGWGYTFPSDAKKDGVLARIFGAWLRLDYVFAGNGFTPSECRVASDERSQHRAVLARFALVP
jgi:endonuclease/exonuclease/phosphatase family metal-dependent hydrolase